MASNLRSSMRSPLIIITLLAVLSLGNCSIVLSTTTILKYHNGPLLTSPISVYVLWYSTFSTSDKATISTFFNSFMTTPQRQPTVSSWWKTTQAYKDYTNKPVSSTVHLASEATDGSCSIGTSLKRADLVGLVKSAIAKKSLAYDPSAIYLVLTASNVVVERFCMDSCGFHNAVPVFGAKTAVVAHVGNPSSQCPGLCAWPFATPAYGPPGPPLVAPNGVGVDGMIINIATILAGVSTNPMGTGYYQGDVLAPLEATTACPGIFGSGAYPGYPGNLKMDSRSKASFNAYGNNGKLYLLPAMWDPLSRTCMNL